MEHRPRIYLTRVNVRWAENHAIWRNEIKIPDSRIARLGEDDNFWPAGAPTHGPNGVCGPCSEMYLDRGEEFGDPDERPGDDTDRFLEYWNHVFMTYDLGADGSLTEEELTAWFTKHAVPL